MTILDELAEKLDGVVVYSNYLSAICIFHEDHKPSLIIHEDRYKCLACGAYGRTEQLLARISSGSFVPSYFTKTTLRNPFSDWLKHQTLPQVLKSSWQYLKEHPWYGKYLEGRGIPHQTQIKCGIGYRDGFVTFPITDRQHKVIGGVTRSINEKNYFVPKGQDPNLLISPSWIRIERATEVFLVYGIVDTFSLHVLGLPTMSTLSGKRLDPCALDWCKKKITIVPDFGEVEDARKLASQLGWRGHVKVLDYPDGMKDTSDLLQRDKPRLEALFA